MPFQRDPQGRSFVQNWLGLMTQIAAAADDLYASDRAHGELIKSIGEKLDMLLVDYAGTALQVARLEEEVGYLAAALRPKDAVPTGPLSEAGVDRIVSAA